jgi:hypothetical protein
MYIQRHRGAVPILMQMLDIWQYCTVYILYYSTEDLRMLCDSVHHSYVDESALCVRRFGHLFEALFIVCSLYNRDGNKMGEDGCWGEGVGQ